MNNILIRKNHVINIPRTRLYIRAPSSPERALTPVVNLGQAET